MIAKTEASGGSGLLPEVLAFTTSLEADRALLREDLVGSLAHLGMLARQGIIPLTAARSLHAALAVLWDEAASGAWRPEGEEDVHMAVEAELARRLGEAAGHLHTARSRNDQVALDLRLHVREQLALALDELAGLLELFAARAAEERDAVLPAYTHRQRAQPVSLGYWFAAHGCALARDAEALAFALSQVDALPLGVGAIAGTSLPTDREHVRARLGFSRLTANGMDTVGDRDFALDFSYATARCLLHLGRLSTDVIDFASSEFGFVSLDGEIACGSSMMPQKRNPDVFELVRGKGGPAVGNLVSLLVTLKGLPGGYNRDLQEDRAAVLGAGPLLRGALSALRLALPRVHFDRERCRAAAEGGYSQATDVAEALVTQGVPFREAYKAVGALVRRCQEQKLPLSAATLELARSVDARFTAEALRAADPRASAARKESPGGTGPGALEAQLTHLRQAAAAARTRAAAVPRLDALFRALREAAP